MTHGSPPRRSLFRLAVLVASSLVFVGLDTPRRSWSGLPVGVVPTQQLVRGGPIYVVLNVLVDDHEHPEAETDTLLSLVQTLNSYEVNRFTVSFSAAGLTAVDDHTPDVLNRLVAERAVVDLHSRHPQPAGGGSLDWQMWAYDDVRRTFDDRRSGGTLRLLERTGLAPASGGGDFGDLLRRAQLESPEDTDLDALGVRLPTEAELLIPPSRIVAAALGPVQATEPVDILAADVAAWRSAETAVSRHAVAEGAIAPETEQNALDDLAAMASLAALSGVDLPDVPGIADFVHGVPRIAAHPRTRATESDREGLEVMLEEDPVATRIALGNACAELARRLDQRGSLSAQLRQRLAAVPESQSVVVGLAWPTRLEHHAAPYSAASATSRSKAHQQLVRKELQRVLDVVRQNPRVRFVAPGHGTQWRAENYGEQLTRRVFALPPSALRTAVTPAEVEVLHRRARIRDIRARSAGN